MVGASFMTTYNCVPPKPTAASQTSITTTVNGRAYTCAVGSSIQVPDFDAFELSANGWGVIPYVASGASRPSPPIMWQIIYDANQGTTAWWNGAGWVRPSNGNAV
jgi:hypothetical protein